MNTLFLDSFRRYTIALLLFASNLWLVGCKPPPKRLESNTNSEKLREIVKTLTSADLPAQAQNIQGHVLSLFATVVDLKFDCSPEELQHFLITSPALPDQLEPGNRALHHNPAYAKWWQPERLKNVASAKTQWNLAKDQVTCQLMTGTLSNLTNQITVYLSFSIEAKKNKT